MKVYARYFTENNINYRRNTLLQFGNCWNLIGSIILINPGSAKPISENKLDDSVLTEISKLTGLNRPDDWREFNSDPTMGWINRIFNNSYINEGKQLNGVIQLFNLFNLRDADLSSALKTYKESDSIHLFSTDDDIKQCGDKPVYFGWGNTGKSKDVNFKILRQKAEYIFDCLKSNNRYLLPEFDENSFYHPRYIQMSSKRPNVQALLNNFSENTNTHIASEYSNVFLPSKNQISISEIQETIQLLQSDSTLIGEYGLNEISEKNSDKIRMTFNGIEDDILELTITSKEKGYIGIRGFKKTNNDFNSGLKHQEKYITVLRELNFVERNTWLGSLNTNELGDGSKISVEEIVKNIFLCLNEFRTELTKEQ